MRNGTEHDKLEIAERIIITADVLTRWGFGKTRFTLSKSDTKKEHYAQNQRRKKNADYSI